MADEVGSRKLLREEHGPGRSYELFSSPGAVQVHVDGASSFMLGPALSRLEFHEVISLQEGKGLDGQPLETRELRLTLVIPTAALAEFLAATTKGLRENQEAIVQGMAGQIQAFQNFLGPMGDVNAADR